MRQFSIGEVVTCIPDIFLRYAAPGDYKIIAAMPDRDGDHIYRIKSPLEEHERVVQESLLVKSEGFLPEKALNKSSRRRSITLPTLRGRCCRDLCWNWVTRSPAFREYRVRPRRQLADRWWQASANRQPFAC